MEFTLEQLREWMDYEPVTGTLTWKVRRGRAQPGDLVDSPRTDGYYQVGLLGKKYMVHRLLWFYVTGAWPKSLIDHKDGVKTNNAWLNLRDADKSLNAQNLKRAHRDNTHGLIGVSFIRGRKTRPFRSEIRHEGRQIHLGTFASAEDAHVAYLNAKRELHEGNLL